MTITTSGTVAIAGTNTSQGGTNSIQQEIGSPTYSSPFTATISLNDAVTRGLAGIASGQISFSNFYGKSQSLYQNGMFFGGQTMAFKGGSTVSNIVTRIDANAAIIGAETTAGTARTWGAGAPTGGYGLFFGGNPGDGTNVNRVTRINSSGTLVGSETNAGTNRFYLSGAGCGGNAMFHNGNLTNGTTFLNTVTRINSSGTQVGSETSAGTGRSSGAGTHSGSNGMYYNGQVNNVPNWTTAITRIDANGAQVGSETFAGSGKTGLQGGTASSNTAVFFGGNQYINGTGYVHQNTVTRINTSGALIGSETNAGTAMAEGVGASPGSNAMFHLSGRITRIDANGALVGTEVYVGTVGYDAQAASY